MMVGRRRRGSVMVLLALGGAGVAARGQSDNCADAPPLPMGVVSFLSAGAPFFTPDGSDRCLSGVVDGWYEFIAPADGFLVLDGCLNTGASVMSVHSGCPGTVDNLIACNYRDSYHCSGRPHLEVACTAGRSYRVRGGGSRISVWFEPPRDARGHGPDVVSGDIPETLRYAGAGGYAAMAFGSSACNFGDANIEWTNSNNSPHHPVISTALYRIKDGVFEQLGYSWVKHGTAAAAETFCDYCPQTGAYPYLLPGCTDSYDVPQNGTRDFLKRRSEINATTGIFPYPAVGNPAVRDSTSRRLRVPAAAIDPGQNAGAVYLSELHYVAADDALAGNAMNNASYRPTTFGSAGAAPAFSGPTVKTRPAIRGWADLDPSVGMAPVDFTDQGYACRLWVGSKVTEVSPGVWCYVYSVFNLNADRAVAGLVLPRFAGAEVLSQQFLFPQADPTEVYSNTPWVFSSGGGEMGWRSVESFATDPNGNAIRWGTAYTMIVTAATAPAAGMARLPLYKPGLADEPVELTAVVPVPGPGPCVADFNGDRFVDGADYLDFVAAFEGGVGSADVNGDDFVDFFDYLDFVDAFGQGC